MMGEDTLSILKEALDIVSLRHNLLANNIANARTPGYVREDIDFSKVMLEALKGRGQNLKMRRTHPTHLTGTGTEGKPEIIRKGSVNMEEELAALVENALAYRVFAQMLSSKIQALREAIRG